MYYLTTQNIHLLPNSALDKSERCWYSNFKSRQKVTSKFSEDIILGRYDDGCDVKRGLNLIRKMQNMLVNTIISILKVKMKTNCFCNASLIECVWNIKPVS